MSDVISLGDGLSIKTLKSGKKVYVVEFSEFKQRKRKVIGYCDIINVTMAKAITEGFRRQIGLALTCDEAFETWFERFASLQTKTYANQKYRYYKYISPAWGKTQMRAITALDVQGLLALYRDRPTLANRLIQLMSSVYNKCAKWGYVSGVNPCQHVDKNRLQSRTRHLSATEMQRIQAALDRLENQSMADAFRLMIFTGCRKMEILSLKWSQINMEAKMFELHDTKNGRPRVIPLVDAAMEVVSQIKRTSKFLFPAASKAGHITSPHKAWQKVCEWAGVDEVRIHDIRRTCGSLLAQHGTTSLDIGNVLGHESAAATRVYARLNVASHRKTLEQYAAIIK